MKHENELKEANYKSKRKALNRSTNRFLYTFLAVFIGGYLIFFTSSLWLPNTYVGVDVTPIGETVTVGDRNVTVDAWTFSKEQKLMEVMIEIENNSIDGIDQYEWTAKTKDGKLPLTVIAADPAFVALHISDVPRDWTEVSLVMQLPRPVGRASKEFEPVQIYVNDKMIPAVSEITAKNLTTYKQQAYQSKIDAFKEQIRLLQRQVRETGHSIREADAKIDEIQSKMEYQTEREKEESNALIDELLAKKENLTREKEEKETEIKELQERIILQKQLLDQVPEDGSRQETFQAEHQESGA